MNWTEDIVVFYRQLPTFNPQWRHDGEFTGAKVQRCNHDRSNGTLGQTGEKAGYAIHGAGGEHYRKEDDPSLPDEIEHIYPDYDLYGIKDTAYGFLTRGCPRGCDFCIVAKKEGLCSRKVADLQEFKGGAAEYRTLRPEYLSL